MYRPISVYWIKVVFDVLGKLLKKPAANNLLNEVETIN